MANDPYCVLPPHTPITTEQTAYPSLRRRHASSRWLAITEPEGMWKTAFATREVPFLIAYERTVGSIIPPEPCPLRLACSHRLLALSPQYSCCTRYEVWIPFIPFILFKTPRKLINTLTDRTLTSGLHLAYLWPTNIFSVAKSTIQCVARLACTLRNEILHTEILTP